MNKHIYALRSQSRYGGEDSIDIDPGIPLAKQVVRAARGYHCDYDSVQVVGYDLSNLKDIVSK